MAQDWTRAVLGVPGMNYSLLLRRSVDFDTYAAILDPAYPDPVEQTLGLSLIQMLWDRAENDGYAQHLTTDPYADTPEHQVLLNVAFGDHQVSMWGAEIMARTIGASVHQPALADGRHPDTEPYWGLDPIDGYPFDGSALVVWDSGAEVPPTTNAPPRAGFDPHEDPRADAANRAQKFALPLGRASSSTSARALPARRRRWRTESGRKREPPGPEGRVSGPGGYLVRLYPRPQARQNSPERGDRQRPLVGPSTSGGSGRSGSPARPVGPSVERPAAEALVDLGALGHVLAVDDVEGVHDLLGVALLPPLGVGRRGQQVPGDVVAVDGVGRHLQPEGDVGLVAAEEEREHAPDRQVAGVLRVHREGVILGRDQGLGGSVSTVMNVHGASVSVMRVVRAGLRVSTVARCEPRWW